MPETFSEFSSGNAVTQSSDLIFLQPFGKDEIAIITSSITVNKASFSNTMPLQISIPLNDEISNHLADLFDLCFSYGVFTSILKTAAVAPVTSLTRC